MKFLFWKEHWVNSRPETKTEGNIMYFEIKLVGVPRLRQVRSKQVPCQLPSHLKLNNFPCYEKYSMRSAENKPMKKNFSLPG